MRRIQTKHFTNLSLHELYRLLALRSEVFVVEQDCAYQDLDDNDQDAWHVWVEDEDGRLLSCLRVFCGQDGRAYIGRMVTRKDRRGEGLGLEALREGIQTALRMYPGKDVVLFAQSYATGFYEKAGFRITGEEFLEDGIPHREMTLKAGAVDEASSIA